MVRLTRVETVLRATALEWREPARAESVRRVRLAELVLTPLDGSAHRAETAPGSGDPFDVAPARPCADTWDTPTGLADQIGGNRVDFAADGLIAVSTADASNGAPPRRATT